MGRRVATVGLGVAGLGLVLTLWWLVLPGLARPRASLSWGVRGALELAPLFGSLLLPTGAVMLALGLLIGITGRVPVHAPPLLLMWSGLLLWVLAPIVELGVLSSLPPNSAAQVVGYPVTSTLEVVGGALAALWLTGRVVGRGAGAAELPEAQRLTR